MQAPAFSGKLTLTEILCFSLNMLNLRCLQGEILKMIGFT